MSYYVIEGEHTDPNNKGTIIKGTKKTHGPFEHQFEADTLAKSIIMQNIDNYYHRAWVVNE